MKLSTALLTGLVAVGLVFAQEAAKTEPAPAKAAPAKALVAHGTVVSVDAIANTLVIKTKKGEETFSVSAETKITSAGKAVALGDVKAETAVSVKYKDEAGKMVATAITEKAAKKAAAEKKAAEPAAAPAAK